MHPRAVERQQLLHVGDALGVQANLGARADAGQVAQVEMGDGPRQLRGQEPDQPVRLLHVAGDLGQVAVGRHADGAAQRLADLLVDALLDLERDAAGARRFLLAAHQLADHLVDGGRVRDRAAQLDRLGDARRVVGVDAVAALDQDDLRADAFGLADLGSGLDAERLGFVAGGDAAGGVGHGGHDGERPVAIFRVQLLLDRREEAVQVDVQEAETVGLELAGHDDLARTAGYPPSPPLYTLKSCRGNELSLALVHFFGFEVLSEAHPPTRRCWYFLLL